jgi:hypothetical protein
MENFKIKAEKWKIKIGALKIFLDDKKNFDDTFKFFSMRGCPETDVGKKLKPGLALKGWLRPVKARLALTPLPRIFRLILPSFFHYRQFFRDPPPPYFPTSVSGLPLTKNIWFGCKDFDNEAFTFE